MTTVPICYLVRLFLLILASACLIGWAQVDMTIDREEMVAHFSAYGEVTGISMNPTRGYAFIDYRSNDCVQSALRWDGWTTIDEWQLRAYDWCWWITCLMIGDWWSVSVGCWLVVDGEWWLGVWLVVVERALVDDHCSVIGDWRFMVDAALCWLLDDE